MYIYYSLSFNEYWFFKKENDQIYCSFKSPNAWFKAEVITQFEFSSYKSLLNILFGDI